MLLWDRQRVNDVGHQLGSAVFPGKLHHHVMVVLRRAPAVPKVGGSLLKLLKFGFAAVEHALQHRHHTLFLLALQLHTLQLRLLRRRGFRGSFGRRLPTPGFRVVRRRPQLALVLRVFFRTADM